MCTCAIAYTQLTFSSERPGPLFGLQHYSSGAGPRLSSCLLDIVSGARSIDAAHSALEFVFDLRVSRET